MSQVLASILYKAAREQSLLDTTKVEEILGIKEETAADPIVDPQMTGMTTEVFANTKTLTYLTYISLTFLLTLYLHLDEVISSVLKIRSSFLICNS